MAELNFNFGFDGSEIAKIARKIEGEYFVALTDFDTLETNLNEIGITFTEDGGTQED